jgi:RNA-directed DNA polymerase
MKLGRKEPDIEGVATHGGPESCVVVREDGGEALTGVHAGGAIEPRNPWSRGADVVAKAEGNIGGSVIRELPPDPARSVNPGMRGSFMGENGEISWSPALVVDAPSFVVRGVAGRPVAGREGNAEAVIPR